MWRLKILDGCNLHFKDGVIIYEIIVNCLINNESKLKVKQIINDFNNW